MRRAHVLNAAVSLMLAAALMFSLSCDDENIPTGSLARPDQLRYLSGSQQTGSVLRQLNKPFTVQVLDSDGNPVPSHKVVFEVTTGNGVFAGTGESTQEAVTNSNGVTSAYLLLGSDSINTATASASGATGSALQGSPVTFTAYATGASSGTGSGSTGGSYAMAGVNLGADTLGYVGRMFPVPFAVKITDPDGQPVAGIEVFYSAVVGGGVFDLDTKETDQYGVAANSMRLSYTPGENIVQAASVLPSGDVARVRWRVISVTDPSVRGNAWSLSTVPEEPDSMVAEAGKQYPVPLVVAVRDTFGMASPGQTVSFLVEQGGGSVNGVPVHSTSTNSEGLAQTNFTLGPSSGLNRIRATVIRKDGLPLSVFFDIWGSSAAITTPVADSIYIVSGDNQQGEVNTILPEPLVVAVLDQFGNPLSGASVTFTVKQGLGMIGEEGTDPSTPSTLTVTTDDQGLAVVTQMLGPGPDLDNIVVAEVRRNNGQVYTATFNSQARNAPDTANRLVIMSGNNQNYILGNTVTTTLPLPIVVAVVDTNQADVNGNLPGTPISNFPVLFTAYGPSGTGMLDDTPDVEPAGTGRLEARTDEDGLAACRWTLDELTGGPDDINVLRDNNYVVAVAVFADGTQDSVVFTATGLPQAATAMEPIGDTEISAVAGTPLSGLGVNVVDQYSNVVEGIGINYIVNESPGDYTFTGRSATTDMYGDASVTIEQVSTKTGEMKISASNGSLDGSPVSYTITILADEADEIMASDGNNQSQEVGTAYTTALRVLVFDQYGNRVPDVRVTFTVSQGSASLSPSFELTDEEGAVESTATPLAEGNITVTATIQTGSGSKSVSFSLTATPES